MPLRLLSHLGDVVHCLQRERGCGTLYLASGATLFGDRLPEAWSETNRAISQLEAILAEPGCSARQGARDSVAKHLKTAAGRVPEIRAELASGSLVPSACVSVYSHQVIAPFLRIMTGMARAGDIPSPALEAYETLLHWKDKVGLERALGGRALAVHAFDDPEFVERFSFLLSEQESYREAFLSLAPDELRQMLETALATESDHVLEELHAELEETRAGARLSDIDPVRWFDLVTEKIDALHAFEQALVSNRWDDPKNAADDEVAVPLSSLKKEQDYVEALPLFSSLSDDDLNALLAQGVVRRLPKGRLLFLEGEQPHHMYVVIEGWVKIFKSTLDGEETILQMQGPGSTLMESCVYLDVPYPASAQVAQDTTLLSLPAPILRERVRASNNLALSVLTNMSTHYQHMIRQIENTRLPSVDDRLGYFLLSLSIEQGHSSRCIKLPYDKSLIASYLNMKRETLSRALGRLKEKGYRIESTTVVTPSLSTLCPYCDPTIAATCTGHDTENCSGSVREKGVA